MHIIYAGGADVKKSYANKLKGARTNAINTVYVGALRCSYQYDALVSFTGNGGGSEIKVFRGSGYLLQDPNGQISNISGDVVSLYFSRGEINNCNHQNINAIWDLDWASDNPKNRSLCRDVQLPVGCHKCLVSTKRILKARKPWDFYR